MFTFVDLMIYHIDNVFDTLGVILSTEIMDTTYGGIVFMMFVFALVIYFIKYFVTNFKIEIHGKE